MSTAGLLNGTSLQTEHEGRVMTIRELVRAKEVIWVGVGQIAQFFGGLVFLKVATNCLTPAEFGTFTVLLTIATLVQTVVLGGVQGAVTRFYWVSKSEGDLPSFIGSMAMIGLALATVIAAVGMIAADTFGRNAQTEMASAVLALTVLAVLTVFSGLINAMDTGARRQGLVSLHTAGSLWLRAAAILVVIPVAAQGYVAALWSVALGSVGILLSQTLFLLWNEKITVNAVSLRRWSGSTLVFALPYMSWGIITWGQQVADRWLLQVFADSQAVGEYVALYQLAYSPVLLISAAVQRLATPVLYEQIGDASETPRVKLAMRIQTQLIAGVFAIGAGLALIAALAHDKCIGLVLGALYRDKSYLLPLFVLAATLMSSYHLAGAIVPAIFQAKKMILPLATMSTVSIAIMAVGAQLGGVEGLAIGLFVSGLGFFVVVSLVARHLIARHLQGLK